MEVSYRTEYKKGIHLSTVIKKKKKDKIGQKEKLFFQKDTNKYV